MDDKKSKFKMFKEKLSESSFVLILTMLAVLLTVFSANIDLKERIIGDYNASFLLLVSGISLFSLGLFIRFIISYLNRGLKDDNYSVRDKIRNMTDELRKVRNTIDNFNQNTTDIDENVIYNSLSEKVKAGIEDDIIEKVKRKFTPESILAISQDNVFKIYQKSQERLRQEVQSTTRRTDVNLIIGIVACLVGIFGFVVILIFAPDNSETLISYFIPRFAMAAFIQIFAYFFLRLYKKGIDDIQYFQNEITNLELKEIAVRYSYTTSSHKENQEIIISDLMKDDRNDIASFNNSADDVNSTDVLEKVIDLIKGLKDFKKS